MKRTVLETDHIDDQVINKLINQYAIVGEQTKETLLSKIIVDSSLSSKIKCNIADYLLKQNIRVNSSHANINGSLLAIALEQQNFEMADLFLANKVDTTKKFNNKNLLDIALESKNENSLFWVLKQIPKILLNLSNEEFIQQYQRIQKIFPEFKMEQLGKVFKKSYEDYENHSRKNITANFSQLGLINHENISLLLAAKMTNKVTSNPIFLLKNNDDITEIANQIKDILTKETNENIIKFQILYYTGQHAICGQFEIDKRKQPYKIRYLHLDSTPGIIKYSEIINENFLDEISKLAEIEIFNSNVVLQKAQKGCTYFALDSVFMLTTPLKNNYCINIMDYIKQHSAEKTKKNAGVSFKLYESNSLPPRFLRGLQYVDDENEDKIDGDTPPQITINSIFNKSDNPIVNKKGETFTASVQKYLIELTRNDEQKKWNVRIDRKMRRYGEIVRDFISGKNILSNDFFSVLARYKIKGLIDFCQSKIKQNLNQIKGFGTTAKNN